MIYNPLFARLRAPYGGCFRNTPRTNSFCAQRCCPVCCLRRRFSPSPMTFCPSFHPCKVYPGIKPCKHEFPLFAAQARRAPAWQNDFCQNGIQPSPFRSQPYWERHVSPLLYNGEGFEPGDEIFAPDAPQENQPWPWPQENDESGYW